MQRLLKGCYLFMLIALLLAGCSRPGGGGGSSVSLQEGRLAMDGIEIDFGGNALDEGTDTALADAMTTEGADGLVSDLYRMDLDALCTEAVTARMDLEQIDDDSDDETGSLVLGIGIEAAEDSDVVLYRFVEADVDGQTVTASFIPAEFTENTIIRGSSLGQSTSASSPVRARLYLGWFRHTIEDAANGHFRVYFPTTARTGGSFLLARTERQALMEDLEAVYQQYLSMGYQYAKRTKWPLDVHIQSLDAEGYYSEGKASYVSDLVYAHSTDYGCIYLNIDLFKNGYQPGTVKPLLAHEFFHFVQYNYASPSTSCTWFDEATATYFEWKAGGTTPHVVSKYWYLLLDGIFPEEDDAANGYARMPLVEYLAGTQSEAFILSAYENGGAEGDWDNALHVAMGGSPKAWAADFYEQYVAEKITSAYGPYLLYKEIVAGTDEFTQVGTTLALTVPDDDEIAAALENDEVPVLGTTTLSVPALGARLVALTIDEDSLEDLADGMAPVLHVEGAAALAAFAIRGNNFEVLRGEGEITLDDFRESIEDKTQYLVLVVGLQDEDRADYEFAVQLKPGLSLASITCTGGDFDGYVTCGVHAALLGAGAIPVNEDGTFNVTVDYAETQYQSTYGKSDNTLFDIWVENLVLDGTWDVATQSGSGTFSCQDTSDGKEEVKGSTGMVKYGYLWESDVKGDFEMEIEAGELVLKFHARYSTRKTETYEYKNTKDEDTWVTDGLGEHFELTFDFEER
jgi:hypothetical protein